MFGQLVPCGGGNAIPLRHPRGVVGRAAECDIKLPYGTVSSKHCLLELRDGVWFVVDLASRNGIRVDGVNCKEGRLLPGGILSVAEYRFQVVYPQSQGATLELSECTPPLERSGTTKVDPGRPSTESRATAPAAEPFPQPAGALLGELVPCGGGAPFPLRKPNLLVGRSSSCDITLPFPKVSGKHCQLEFKDGFWHVRDLGSSNGVRVDGVAQTYQSMKPGAILSIAEHRYEVAYTLPEVALPVASPVAPAVAAPVQSAVAAAVALPVAPPAETPVAPAVALPVATPVQPAVEPPIDPPTDPQAEDDSSECVLDEAEPPPPAAPGAFPNPPVSAIETKRRWTEDDDALK